MTEIKFRIWMPNEGFDVPPKMYNQVVAGGFSQTVPQVWEESSDRGWVNAWVDNEEPDGVFMQYTGLKDKNGVEIYKGDILRYESIFEDEESRDNPDIYEVEWRGHGWFAVWTGNYASKADGLNDCEKDMVVIGNIYENPELIPEVSQK